MRRRVLKDSREAADEGSYSRSTRLGQKKGPWIWIQRGAIFGVVFTGPYILAVTTTLLNYSLYPNTKVPAQSAQGSLSQFLQFCVHIKTVICMTLRALMNLNLWVRLT